MARGAAKRGATTVGEHRQGQLAALAGAGLVLGCALIGVSVVFGPGAAPPLTLALSEVAADAPPGWRQALQAPHGLTASEGTVQLSEHPLAAAEAAQNASVSAAPVTGGPLPAAPIAGFFAQGPGGPLPIISKDGKTPFDIYSRPFVGNGRPKVALVIGGMGLNGRATRQAIETLPPAVTLSFAPYADGLQGWIDLAREHGHEVLLEAPMEPVDYPDNDPGPYTLMAKASPSETAKRLEWVLSRAAGYMGLTNYLGSRFLADDAAYGAFAAAAKNRGLAFIDDGSAARRSGGGLPRASATLTIDDTLTRAAIDQQFLQLEANALQNGQAMGWGFAYPVSLEAAQHWASTVEQRGYQLAPASALAVKK
jgi:polysaccharide deacetylase 2 family uncharacterized protein YibQ